MQHEFCTQCNTCSSQPSCPILIPNWGWGRCRHKCFRFCRNTRDGEFSAHTNIFGCVVLQFGNRFEIDVFLDLTMICDSGCNQVECNHVQLKRWIKFGTRFHMNGASNQQAYKESLCTYDAVDVLWVTPSAAGPRPLLIALRLQILDIGTGSWHFWYANLSFGILGGFELASRGTPGRSWARDSLRSRLGFY